jgi:hypothetical protein
MLVKYYCYRQVVSVPVIFAPVYGLVTRVRGGSSAPAGVDSVRFSRSPWDSPWDCYL